MSITVSLPIAAPTNLTSTLVAGGSLAASTTYYYIVIAFDGSTYSPGDYTKYNFHSPISAEGSFTTDTTNKSVKINWDNVSGAIRYQILLTTTSGDYTNSGGYGTTAEGLGSITSGVTGYTITALSTENYVVHSIQLVNPLVGDIDRSLGILKVAFSGTSTHDLDDVYDAIVAAGFSDYVNYDEITFIFKGWFVSESNDAGKLVVENKTLIFLKGGIHCGGTNYYMRFGRASTDIIGANYIYGCRIDILNSRYPIRAVTDGLLKIYGCMVSFCHNVKTALTENKSNAYYLGPLGQSYFSAYVSEIKDNILCNSGRSTSGDIVDLKWAQGNNWGNGNHVRLRITSGASMPYFAGGKFYACTFMKNLEVLEQYTFFTSTYYTDFYDCLFPTHPGGMIVSPYFKYGNLLVANDYQSNDYYNFNYSLAIKIVDENGDAIEGATISLADKDGNPVTWIENDGTYNKLVTGNTYSTDRTTDVNGEIDYYVESYRITLNPENVSNPTSTDIIKTDRYPFTLTVSKTGYETYTDIIDALSDKYSVRIALKSVVKTRVSVDGTFFAALAAETGSSAKLVRL